MDAVGGGGWKREKNVIIEPWWRRDSAKHEVNAKGKVGMSTQEDQDILFHCPSNSHS